MAQHHLILASENNNNNGAASNHAPSPRSRHETLINPKIHEPAVTPTHEPKTRASLGRGNGSPKYLEAPKSPKENNVHGRITRLAGAASRRDEVPSAVPRFGEWEDKDDVSAQQGYTRAFDRISDEKNMPAGGRYAQSPNYRGTPKQTPQRRHEFKISCCFFWRRQ